MLSKEKIISLFKKLNNKLKEKEIKGEVGIVGGTVMCLVYGARTATKDVDAVFEPSGKIRKLAAELAKEEGIDPDWLNDGVKGFMVNGFDKEDVLTLSNLTVWAPDIRYMLAMKCMSIRADSHDGDDIRFLVTKLGLKNSNEVFDIISKYYPRSQILPKTQFFIEEILS